jgi:hypothetical protein
MKTFLELRKINVNEHTEKKGRFTYLSWTWAVDQLLENDPTATWTFGDPTYFAETLMVYCTVTAFGKSMTCQMPVINNSNKAIPNPNAMDVNTAMQRCLVKTIALFGIGLYIYAGEDLPQEDPIDPTTLQRLLEAISYCMNLNELKAEYINACKLVVNDPLALKSLELAKDKRKGELGA